MEITSITKELNKKTFEPYNLVTLHVPTIYFVDLRTKGDDVMYEELGKIFAQALKEFYSKKD
jgi:hypothetical protein